jgi:predicted anti-sigma-YlaC factor YlaD
MSRHVSEWLNAYHDGELRGNRLHQVEAHLAECELCQTELESLEGLSNLLHEVPAPKMISPERFAAQVNLRMPHTQTIISRRQVMEIGWWLIPVGILGVWVFISTSTALSGILYEANRLGLLNSISGWIAFSPSSQISLAATLAQSGLLSGNSLNWAETTETFTRITLPQIGWQISIALLYLSWIAIWWVRHTRGQQHGQLLEG